ncbi:DNA replication/repair protein RecF [Ruminococcaceae bacterium OttesenSCG-928-I18]|nr:DNA replication/repair protein RecF [Ruminococcaceae bacterium OttesenSCG-928-I18]
MNLRFLELADFRNIKKADFVPHEELTIITGENGQGKTNLLESIFLLTGSKSFRASRDIDLVRRGCLKGWVRGKTLAAGRESEIEITLHGQGAAKRGRFAAINKVEYGRATAIAGTFTAVVFAPEHLSLVKSGPEGRRRFLDAALCQLYPGYISILRRFTRALSQKNALLKKYWETRDAEELLDVFDAELAEAGAEISGRRRQYLERMGPMAEQVYAKLSKGRERLEVCFVPCCGHGDIGALLKKTRERDKRAGFCTAGPHREDVETLVDGQSARVFGSQGQQRSVVLSLKLAEAERAKEVSGEHPVMLLDDVLSELDETRQAFLLSGMQGKQNFLTTCDPTLLKQVEGKVVTMEQGEVKG